MRNLAKLDTKMKGEAKQWEWRVAGSVTSSEPLYDRSVAPVPGTPGWNSSWKSPEGRPQTGRRALESSRSGGHVARRLHPATPAGARAGQ